MKSWFPIIIHKNFPPCLSPWGWPLLVVLVLLDLVRVPSSRKPWGSDGVPVQGMGTETWYLCGIYMFYIICGIYMIYIVSIWSIWHMVSIWSIWYIRIHMEHIKMPKSDVINGICKLKTKDHKSVLGNGEKNLCFEWSSLDLWEAPNATPCSFQLKLLFPLSTSRSLESIDPPSHMCFPQTAAAGPTPKTPAGPSVCLDDGTAIRSPRDVQNLQGMIICHGRFHMTCTTHNTNP